MKKINEKYKEILETTGGDTDLVLAELDAAQGSGDHDREAAALRRISSSCSSS